MADKITNWNDPHLFYGPYARRYAEVSHKFMQSVYSNSSHPLLTGDIAIINRMRELIPSKGLGLDAGCGAGSRDVFFYWQFGYDIWGIDAVLENIEVTRQLHPEIKHRVAVKDLTHRLNYPNEHFNFILCNAVIQHISPEYVLHGIFQEFNRILKPGGIMQLVFKTGTGIEAKYDKDYGTERQFQLYEPSSIIASLDDSGFQVIPGSRTALGGVMFFTDTKPMNHCLIFAQKTSPAPQKADPS